jgi:uncharacterized protein (DUF2267 family)
MQSMHAQGFSLEQISNAVSVLPGVVESVLNGTWGKQEDKQKREQKALDKKREAEASNKEVSQAAAIGSAVAQALKENDNAKEEKADPPADEAEGPEAACTLK